MNQFGVSWAFPMFSSVLSVLPQLWFNYLLKEIHQTEVIKESI